MYERILNKQETPSIEDMTAYCGGTAEWFTLLNEWLSNTYETAEKIVFPYGNNYGWGIAHRVRSILICNIFPEDGAFCHRKKRSSGRCFFHASKGGWGKWFFSAGLTKLNGSVIITMIYNIVILRRVLCRLK